VDEEGRIVISGDVTATVEFPSWQRTSTKTTDELYTQLSNIYGQLDITLSALRDAITAPSPDSKTLADLYERLDSIRSQLDVVLSSRASESTVSSILSQLDIALSELRDALKGAGNKDFTTLEADVESILAQLDITLSNLRDTLHGDLYNATDALSVYDHLKQVRTQVDSYLPNLDTALSTRASESTLSSILSQLDITLSALRDAITTGETTGAVAKALYDVWERLDSIRTQLDTALSTRASETTLSSILSQLDIALSELRDALTTSTIDTTTYTKTLADVWERLDSIRSQLDVALSTRASESTVSTVADRLYDSAEAKSLTAIAKEIRDKSEWGYLPNLDVALSTRASESTLSSILGQLDIKVSELRDALKKSTIDTTEYEKSLADIWYQLTQTLKIHEQTPWNPPNLDVALSSFASQAYDSAADLYKLSIERDNVGLLKTGDLSFDASGYLNINAQVVANPPNLDVALSTRASESTLSSVKTLLDKLEDALASVGTDKIRIDDAGGSITVDGTVNIGNFPTDFPDSGTHTKLDNIYNRLYDVHVTSLPVTKGDWLSAIPNPSNLNVDLQSVRRTIASFPPESGPGASLPSDSPWHWIDDTDYTVTETTYTQKTYCRPRVGWLPSRSVMLEWGVKARIDTAGETLYVRIRSESGRLLEEMSFTETSFTPKYKRLSITFHAWEHDQLFIEAYVTGGTGYIDWVKLYFIPVNVPEGWTGTWGEGEQFKPIRVDSDGYPLVRIVGCL